MKQVYPTCNYALRVDHANASTKRQPSFLSSIRKIFFLLYAILLLVPTAGFGNDRKPDRDHWCDCDRFWTVAYNLDSGSIDVQLRFYDDDFGALDADGWVDETTLSYSIDGSYFTEFYYLDWNHANRDPNDVHAMNGVNAAITQSWIDGNQHWLTLRLRLTTALQQIQKIKIAGKWKVYNLGDDGIGATKDITLTSMTQLNNPTFSFETVDSSGVYLAKARINFSKGPLNAVDNLSAIYLYNGDSTAASGNLGIATSGHFDVRLSNSERTFYFVQSAYGGRITTQSGSITVPAFTLPKTASATYDIASHTVTFSWTMDAATGSNPVSDQFKLQIDNNQYFSSPTYATVGYVASQTSYNYTYTVDENFAPTMYFRVARDHTQPQFNWELAQSANLTVTFNSIVASSARVALQNNTAHITWLPTPDGWLPGSSFIIRRTNTTNNSQTSFTLNETEYNRGYYDDPQIAICNQYVYSLQVQPPSNFTAFGAVQLANRILPTESGTISNFVVSKGYFPDRTELTWSAQGDFETFIVKRAVYGTSNFVQLATVPGSANSSFSIDDSKGTPGVYYTYMVLGTSTCNNQLVYSQDTLYAVGFRSPTGNIYGRITFENGQAVENVAVRLQSNDQAQLGQSVWLNGNAESYLKLDSLITPFEDTALTVEAWIKPKDSIPANQVLLSRGGQYELGFDNTGKLYFTYNNTSTVSGNFNDSNHTYLHVAGVHRKDSMFLLLNDTVIAKDKFSFASSTPQKPVYIGRKASGGNNYTGYIDEIRVWNIALSTATVARDYTRMLAGNENGLVAYWRLDETITNQFYDASYHGDRYNQNDGSMNAQQVQRSKTIPAAEVLGLKAFTDASGNYIITGIPFIGNGTTYTVAPLLGTHQFDPTSANRLISTYSPVFTVDFKDKSSFPVSGHVYYKNSTIPVSNVQFKIDGKLAQQSNGAIIESKPDGEFVISVPVGVHEVQAVKNNHVFVNDGKITDLLRNNLNYQNIVSGVELFDSTTVRFIGRVAGGPIQEALPLGHSVSVNNLGTQLSISMKLASEAYKLCAGPDSTVENEHLLPSNQTDPKKVHKTRVEYQHYQMTIFPDSITGEFVVDMIPEKFLATNVAATGWPNLLKNDLTLDLTNKFSIQKSTRDYIDSVENNQIWVKTNYSDTVNFNASYKFIWRITPSVSVSQVDYSGNPLPYFGNPTYHTVLFSGDVDTVSVIDDTKTGIAMYKYGLPIFNQNQLYTFLIKAFEAYPFYETDGVVKQQNGKELIDLVPTRDGFVSINNSLRNGPTIADTLSLNSEGSGLYQFVAGDPDLLANGVKDFAATIRFGQATDVTWHWNNGEKLSGYVMGGKITGTDFVTAGPNKVLFVLRDPPGSKSFSFIEKGSVIKTSSKYKGTIKNAGEFEWTHEVATEMITFTGVGVGTINTAVAGTGFSLGVTHEEHFTGSNATENTTTLTTNFKTSDDPLFVGPPGDVFVGYSTNITYGQSNNITIIRRSELKEGDVPIYPLDDASSSHLIVKRNGISIGQVFGTLFAYPQQHLEYILIPNLIRIRNSMLDPFIDSTTAQTKADNSNKILYISNLPVGDANFGKSNNDTLAFGIKAATTRFDSGYSYRIYFPKNSLYRTDTIMILNQYVENWKQRMADNEKDKLEAVLDQNYSFHSGAPVEYSKETSVNTEHEYEFSAIIGGSAGNTSNVKIKQTGFEFKWKESVSTEHGGDFINRTETPVKFGFTLASEGTDDYFSVDVGIAKDSAYVFRTKGGSSGCPYAGVTETKYYRPGTVFDQPTLRNEVPVITVDNPVATNVPSSRKASYILYLKNESESKLPETYVLNYVNNDSIKGATISVDGLSIANGRAIPIQYGETIQKVLTIERGPEAMDYNNLMILWHSPCQYDPTGYRENIADTVLVSAHFIPSCSDIAIKSPKDKWVLNTASSGEPGKRYLPIIIDQFDVNNSLFDHIELQYKPSATSTWITAMKFYANQAKYDQAQGEKQLIGTGSDISFNLLMNDASFSDQRYDVQAVSYCNLGGGVYVTTESNLVSGIKDTYNPRLFGSPQPANGILTVNDDVRLNFNETIAAGLLTNANFQVTGIRNGAPTSHSVSVKLDGTTNYLATEFEKSFTGKNITAEMWILPSGLANQTVFSHGDANGSLELALTSDRKMKVTVGNNTITSTDNYPYEAGQWAHVALIYNDKDKTVSTFYNFYPIIKSAPVNAYTGTGVIEYGRSIRNKNNYFNGKIHEARIWNDTLNSVKLQLSSLKVLSGAENALLAYYPMNEGKGTVILDKAHGSNAMLNGLWSTPVSKAVSLNGNGYVKISTAHAPVDSTMDYTLELWFKGDASQANSILASNGKGDGTDPNKPVNLFSLGFETGLLTFQNNGFKVQADGNYLDNNWHQVAVAVNRNSGSAQLSVDGKLNQFFDAQNLGGIASGYTYLGARAYFTPNDAENPVFDRYFKGYLDEFRIWDSYLDQTFISKYNNVRLQGNEIGLLAYYPFERYITYQGAAQAYYSLKDAKLQKMPSVDVPDAVPVNADTSNVITAPIKDRGPVENLRFDFVANNDAVIINLLEPKQSIEKSVITFKAEDVRDVNGNLMVSPVTWTAYIDQNLVKWGDKEINLEKVFDEPLDFSSYLVNNGGNSQHYTLSNLPSWLTASPSSGSVDPNSSQKIQFKVNEWLNIGSYEEMIFMHNDNNETEALKVTLKVKGKQPDWVVKPSDYAYNMVVYGKIRMDSIFSINEEDMLGAFLNGKCIGVTNNTYNASNNLWYTFLTMYSNDVSNSNIEFRIWQAKTGKTFIATPSKTIAFANNAVIGTVTAPVIFDGSTQYYRYITVNNNWSWISFSLAIPKNTTLNTTLQNGTWTITDVIKYEGGAGTFSNWTAAAGWTGTLKALDNLSLYKLKAANAQTLAVSGTAVNVESTVIPLKGNSWSYISYLLQLNCSLKEAMAGYQASDEDVIKSQTGFAMYSRQNGWVGSLTHMEPGKGYMLFRKRTTDTSFRYPVITGSVLGVREGQVATNTEQIPVPANFSYADNMTIIAAVAPGFDLRSGDNIIAYANGAIVGKARPIQNPVINRNTYFFNIGGDAEQAIVFMVERDGSMVAQSGTVVQYHANGIAGTLAKPLELQFVKNTDFITVNPNPFNQSTIITVDLSGFTGTREMQLSVFDVAGSQVWTMPVQKLSAMKYTTIWNGTNSSGGICTNGVYFIRVTVNGVSHMCKVIKQ
jgi:hypothetical protein